MKNQFKKDNYSKKNLNNKKTTLEMMAVINVANIIGIDFEIISKLLKIETFSCEKTPDHKLDNLINKVDNLIEDEDFKRKIRLKIAFIKEYGTFTIKGNSFKGNYTDDETVYNVEILITDNTVTFKSNDGNKKLTGKFQKNKNGTFFIKYFDKEQTIHHLNDKESYNIETKKLFKPLTIKAYKILNIMKNQKRTFI